MLDRSPHENWLNRQGEICPVYKDKDNQTLILQEGGFDRTFNSFNELYNAGYRRAC
jgi:hypothetical protein